ncbi:J domain-containing protein [Chitinimonas arctica]|uniref:J domain-containing protein n=1 Tax=Chitinimonas arctica TaxID=2594795 RepID=A0A516SDR0_9NEIS|nr:J domain-containing protein [Chitinimonas arctica]QDQ26281.1 J domain-containing protein [Chitinimonas arctica]
MTHAPCWQLLGLAPTPDEREIKRAYARLLKTTRPEDDPQAFQALRSAFEEALFQSDELARQPPAGAPDEMARSTDEVAAEQLLRPYIEQLAELNERGGSEETMAALDALLDRLALREPAGRDPVLWRLLEDGILWVCCDIEANHDDFLRAAMNLFGWAEPGNWLGEKDPKTVEWLRLRLKEADALESVDGLLDLLEMGHELEAIGELARLADDEMLVNVDVRHLFEAELMVGLSALQPAPAQFNRRVVELFSWQKDHRHLAEYHPEAWADFGKQLGLLPFGGR